MTKKRVAVAIIEDDYGRILFGFRRDAGKWTIPGGHVDKGETPEEGLFRELKEETSLDVVSAKLVKVDEQEELTGYIYSVKVSGTIDVSNDPDQEFSHLEYKDIWDIRKVLYIPWPRNWAAQFWGGF